MRPARLAIVAVFLFCSHTLSVAEESKAKSCTITALKPQDQDAGQQSRGLQEESLKHTENFTLNVPGCAIPPPQPEAIPKPKDCHCKKPNKTAPATQDQVKQNPIVSYRVGDQRWKKVEAAKDKDDNYPLSLTVASNDYFILLALGDCTPTLRVPACFPFALMVNIAALRKPPAANSAPVTHDAPSDGPDGVNPQQASGTTDSDVPPAGVATKKLTPIAFRVQVAAPMKFANKEQIAINTAAMEGDPVSQVTPATAGTQLSTSAWKQLIIWNDADQVYQLPDDYNDFFGEGSNLRVVINGNLVGEFTPPAPGKPFEAYQVRVRANAIATRNRSWSQRALDPEDDINVRIYSVPDGCRDYIPLDQPPKQPIAEISIPAARRLDRSDENGITLGGPKIFDSFLLKQKLANTVSQLSSLNAFSQAQLTAQVGTLQGITRDTSFFAAQLTTSPTPSVTSTANALTGNTVNTTAPAGTGSSIVASVCPSGFTPTLPAGATAAVCVPTSSVGSTPVAPSQTTITTNPATNQTVTTVTQPTQQVVTTTPSLTGAVPTAPTLNPLSPPTNVGLSASDTLDEQTRLNAQLITLQTLLQGAASDQLLLTHGRAVGERAQTTLGFPISINTPPEHAGAVAEVRILVLPRRDQAVISQPVSIVNLLPSEKVYNVAKVTSNSKQFGAGVALQLLSFGFTTGKSKDRLYLAKDTDTVALQYPVAAGSDGTDCGNLPVDPVFRARYPDYYVPASAVMFGWQYRPVLGAVAVAPGVRTGFAQLALPQSDNLAFKPEVWVQTRWRNYDQKKQIVGEDYEGCHWRKLPDPIFVINPVVVKDVRVTDEGGGNLLFHATGDFFSSTGQVRSGTLNAPPTYFDGYSLDFFKLAADILANGPLQLLDEAMHGYRLVTPVKNPAACRIANPKLSALPLADGTSLMELDYNRPNYKPDRDKDGPQHPLLLIGPTVYGIRDKPLQATQPGALIDSACQYSTVDNAAHCKFKFVAKTEDISSAQNFLVRDPAWDSEGVTGSIQIDPTFTKIEAIAKPTPKDDSGAADDFIPGCTTCAEKREAQRKAKEKAAAEKAKAAKDAKKAKDDKAKDDKDQHWFLLSGTNLSLVESAEKLNADTPVNYCNCEKGCLQILEDGAAGAKHVAAADIKVASESKVWLKLHDSAGVHVFWSTPDRPTAEWELSLKQEKPAVTGDPAVLYETDSRIVTFSGADFSKVTAVTFETTPLAIPVPVTKSKLVVQVTSAVTAKFGHKELLALAGADDSGKPKYIVLPIDVVKH